MSFYQINVVSDDPQLLLHALTIAMSHSHVADKGCWGWGEHPEKGLILFAHPLSGRTKDLFPSNPFPTRLRLDQVVPMVKQWLSVQQYGREPDHDGSNSKGWHVFTESYGGILLTDGYQNSWEAICAIKPVWIEHGK